jgi:hypothetical protein
MICKEIKCANTFKRVDVSFENKENKAKL